MSVKAKLEARFNAEKESYETLKQAAERAVVKWRYSREMLWSYHPEQQDILTTNELPDSKGAERAYGYDKTDRVVCVRGYTIDRKYDHVDGKLRTTETQRVSNEEFIRHTGDIMEITSYYQTCPPERERRLHWIYEARTKDGRVIALAELGNNGFNHVEYFWEGNRLKGDRNLDENGKVTLESEIEPDGTVKLYQLRKDGSRYLLGQPLPKGVTVKSLAETVRKRLLKVIPGMVKGLKLKEPAYCVALAYDGEGNDVLGPSVGIGLESERKKWLAERGKDAWQLIWNPAEFQHYEKPHTQLEDEELEQASDWLNEALANRESAAPAVKLLVEVAADLEKLDWSKILKITPDFCVYAVDFELGDLKKNLKKILPARKLAALKAAKLI
jgi:hypothetical protein